MKNNNFFKATCAIVCILLYSCSETNDDQMLQKVESDLKKSESIEILGKTENGNDILNLEGVTFNYKQDGNLSEITIDKIKSIWESEIFRDEQIVVDLIEFTLIKSYDEEDQRYFYFLKARDKDNQISTGSFIDYTPQKSTSSSFELGAGKKECSCKGNCGSGCSLSINGSQCSCSDCWPLYPSSKCEKTEKQTVGI